MTLQICDIIAKWNKDIQYTSSNDSHAFVSAVLDVLSICSLLCSFIGD